MKFCDKLQKIRKEHNITQEGLADKLNVSRQAVSKWESGSAYPDTEKLIQISKLFNVSLDDLINDNSDMSKTNTAKKFNFMETFDMVFEFISKLFKMFWSMKFWEKCKFLIEMVLVILAIWGIAAISGNIICGLVRRIFAFMPYGILNGMVSVVDTLLYIIWIVLGCIIFVKVLKTRYLDYYIIVTDDTVTEETIEEPIKELKEKKDYKIVIRDPEHSSFNFFKKVGNVLLFCFKLFCIFFAFPFVIAFIFFVAALVISLLYVLCGLFFNGISLTLIGIIIFIYLALEFMYNLIFNRKHSYLRAFILFMISISLVGIGIGLSFISLDSFTTYEKEIAYDREITQDIKMHDNLVIPDIMDISDDKIIIDDSLEDIKFDFVTLNDAYVSMDSYHRYEQDSDKVYEIMNIYTYRNGFKTFKRITKDLKKRRINTNDFNSDGKEYEIKNVYISSNNLTKLINNYNEIYD